MNISRLIKRTRSFARRGCAPLTALAYAPPLFAQTEVAKTRVDPMSAEYVVKTAVGMFVVFGFFVVFVWFVCCKGKMNSNMSNVVKTAVGMIVVIGIIVALAWLVRRKGKMNGLMSGEVKIVSSLSLGAREKIVLVQVGEEQFLLGATPQQINRIARIKSPVDAGAAAAPAERLTFQQLFAKLKHGPRA